MILALVILLLIPIGLISAMAQEHDEKVKAQKWADEVKKYLCGIKRPPREKDWDFALEQEKTKKINAEKFLAEMGFEMLCAKEDYLAKKAAEKLKK